MNYTCVVTSDHHPMLCGTAKFSHQLAERLGVPCLTTFRPGEVTLVSVRASEFDWACTAPFDYSLFLHDADTSQQAEFEGWVKGAWAVYVANSDIGARIQMMRPDVIQAWAPSTIRGNSAVGLRNVLTFGMAHKIQPRWYQQLNDVLRAAGDDYTVSVSTAIHEGSPWDETARVAERLAPIFGARLRVLGYLADDALAAEMKRCTSVALFYDPALRANNTTFWSAYEADVAIYTNLDAQSPEIQAYRSLGNGLYYVPRGHRPAHSYTWDALLGMITMEQACVV